MPTGTLTVASQKSSIPLLMDLARPLTKAQSIEKGVT